MNQPETRTEQNHREWCNYKLLKIGAGEVTEIHRLGKQDGAEESFREILSPDGIHFWHWNSTGNNKRVITLENTTPFIQFNFSIFANSTYRDEDENRVFAKFHNHEYNILYYPARSSVMEWDTHEKAEFFGLNILPEMFAQYVSEDHSWIKKINSAQPAGKPMKLSDLNLPVIPNIKSILYEILHCPLNNHYKRLYLKAKTIELMMLVLNHFEEYSQKKNIDIADALREKDIVKMQQAREILHENFQNPCSLIDLAHQVGTNENYLKKHFKQVFGNTVYGYVQDLRMQQAKMLLMKENYDIHKVARSSGYKHTHHFVAAFKKYFGYAPVKLRMWMATMIADSGVELFAELGCAI